MGAEASANKLELQLFDKFVGGWSRGREGRKNMELFPMIRVVQKGKRVEREKSVLF